MDNTSDPDYLSANPPSVKGQIFVSRVIWAALLMGELLFAAVVAGMIIPNKPKPAEANPVLVWVSFIMCLTVIPATLAIRQAMFRRSRAAGGGVLAAGMYVTGNIVLWAGCDGIAFFGLVAGMINGSLWPTIVPVAIAMAVQVMTFPTAMKLEGAGGLRG